MINLKSYDLFISEFDEKDDNGNTTGERQEVVRIDSRLAFNKQFIQECKDAGVKKWKPKDDPNDDVSDHQVDDEGKANSD